MRPYRPANGTDGEIFMAAWCDQCPKDDPENDLLCPIIAGTMAFFATDPQYPKAWVCDDDGANPRCTAFDSDAPVVIDGQGELI